MRRPQLVFEQFSTIVGQSNYLGWNVGFQLKKKPIRYGQPDLSLFQIGIQSEAYTPHLIPWIAHSISNLWCLLGGCCFLGFDTKDLANTSILLRSVVRTLKYVLSNSIQFLVSGWAVLESLWLRDPINVWWCLAGWYLSSTEGCVRHGSSQIWPRSCDCMLLYNVCGMTRRNTPPQSNHDRAVGR